MSALLRERIRIYFKIVAAAALIGILYTVFLERWPPTPGELMTGLVNSVGISAAISLFEIFVFPSSRLRWIASLPFAAVVAIKTMLYCAIVLGVLSRGGATSPSALAFVFSLLVTLIFVVVMQ